MEILEKLSQKKNALDAARPLPATLTRNLDEWFKVELTFTSNAIEGNTLTRHETAVVIEKGLTNGGKSLREHLEATNHAKALDL
jgi:Fic family protein